MKDDKNKKEKKPEYPVMTYLISFFLAAVLLVLISYFSNMRNHAELNEYSHSHSAAVLQTADLKINK